MSTPIVRFSAAGRVAPSLAADLADLLHTLVKALFDPYRPELHYMRGPGPKWRAKHTAAVPDARMIPVRAVLRVRA